MFSNRDLRRLLIPLIIEQVLTALMGTVDTMMVSQVGEAAISGVSLVDTINKLMQFLFTALATGGTIVVAQYLGRQDKKHSDLAGQQVLLTALFFGLAIMILCLICRKWALHLIFGQVEEAVMTAAEDYFLVTVFSYPFLALYNASAALYRSTGNSRLPMTVSICSNILNVVGNAVFLFVLNMGVTGAALSTVISFALSAVVMLIFQRRPNQAIEVGKLTRIRPNWRLMMMVLRIGLPTGVENAMFQFGKIMVQSTVSTLGTTAIAANAIVTVLEYMSSMPSTAIGTGLMTVAGQCIGAGRLDEAKGYIRKLTGIGALALLASDLIIMGLTFPVVSLSGMDSAASSLTITVMVVITIVKPFLWPLSFLPLNGMRAAGDVRFGMIVSTISMWVLRVGLTMLLCRVLNVGLIGIWIGYFADWFARSIIFTARYFSGRWTKHNVLDYEE